jgi:hypothetical protein
MIRGRNRKQPTTGFHSVKRTASRDDKVDEEKCHFNDHSVAESTGGRRPKGLLFIAPGGTTKHQLIANPMDCHDVLWIVGVGLNSLS